MRKQSQNIIVVTAASYQQAVCTQPHPSGFLVVRHSKTQDQDDHEWLGGFLLHFYYIFIVYIVFHIYFLVELDVSGVSTDWRYKIAKGSGLWNWAIIAEIT